MNGVAAAGAPELMESRMLPFLNITRCVVCVVFAVIALRLMTRSGPASAAPGRADLDAARLGAAGEGGPPSPRNRNRFLFFVRLVTKGVYPEYLHLALALFFPLVGMLISWRGDAVLKGLIVAALICYGAAPVLLSFEESSPFTVPFTFSVRRVTRFCCWPEPWPWAATRRIPPVRP